VQGIPFHPGRALDKQRRRRQKNRDFSAGFTEHDPVPEDSTADRRISKDAEPYRPAIESVKRGRNPINTLAPLTGASRQTGERTAFRLRNGGEWRKRTIAPRRRVRQRHPALITCVGRLMAFMRRSYLSIVQPV